MGTGEKLVIHFADRKDKNIYPEKIGGRRYSEFRTAVNRYAKFLPLFDGTADMAFLSLDTNILTRIYKRAEITEDYVVAQYSSSADHSVILYKYGKVKAEGSNSCGQCNTRKFHDIAFILAAPSCTYAVDREGGVHIAGKPVFPGIRDWTGVRALAGGKTFVLALQENGRVLIAGKMEDHTMALEVKQWKNITAICAADNCCIGLKEDGTVVFAGSRKEDPRGKTDGWTDIAAVTVADGFAAGLTRDGVIRVAGTCRKSDIGAIRKHGEIFLKGNFSGDMETIKQICEAHMTDQ